jgi:hypothetical protein
MTKLERLWIVNDVKEPDLQIRVDFDNDWHILELIKKDCSPMELVESLRNVAECIDIGIHNGSITR